ncbi:MAG: AAA family ATPase [Rhizobiaceae bacterium]
MSDRIARKTKKYFKDCFPNRVIVVPTLGQFELDEKPNDPEYVERIQHTRLAARNFRNIWKIKTHEEFTKFRELVEDNWDELEIQKPRVIFRGSPELEMIYNERGVAREVGMAGFGFQAWIQIMTHMLRGESADILVLDEPDVYLHADLQRRLFGIAKKRFGQLFLATHSAEIMNEANSGDVVLVRSDFQTGKRLTTEEGYRSAHALLGSTENADFARLSRAKRIIAYEGNDRAIYRRFEQAIIPDGVFSDPDTVMLKIGGFEQWPKVGNIPWAFEELFGIRPKIAAIFDRDYRCIADIEAHERRLEEAGIYCRVLRRKEIENYVVQPNALAKAIRIAASKRGKIMESAAIGELALGIANKMRDEALLSVQSFATKYYTQIRDRRDTKEILKVAKIEFDREWNEHGYWTRISGKDYLSSINQLLDKECGASLSLFQILDEMSREEIDGELEGIIMDINKYFSEG